MDGGVGVGVKDIKAAMQTFDVFYLNIYTSLKVFSKIFPTCFMTIVVNDLPQPAAELKCSWIAPAPHL